MEKEELMIQLTQEHDSILNILSKISCSLMTEQLDELKNLLNRFDEEAGPHFRFDEEAVYPSLVDVYYPGYISKLYTDHDLAIARFNQLKHLFAKPEPNASDFYDGIRQARMISQYITSCDILPIGHIPLNDQQIKKISSIHKRAKTENLSLICWSDTVRKRKQLYFN